MLQPGLAERWRPYEVVGDRQLTESTPAVALLRTHALFPASGSPFSVDLGKTMVKTVSHLLGCVPGARYGYAAGESLSVLFLCGSAPPRSQELLVTLASQASAKLSLLLSRVAAFDAQLYGFPNLPAAFDYFQGCQESAWREALHRYCIFVLGHGNPNGMGAALEHMGDQEKVELLRQHGIDFEQLPHWQLRGSGVYVNPNGASTEARLVVDPNLPAAEAYTAYLERVLQAEV